MRVKSLRVVAFVDASTLIDINSSLTAAGDAGGNIDFGSDSLAISILIVVGGKLDNVVFVVLDDDGDEEDDDVGDDAAADDVEDVKAVSYDLLRVEIVVVVEVVAVLEEELEPLLNVGVVCVVIGLLASMEDDAIAALKWVR